MSGIFDLMGELDVETKGLKRAERDIKKFETKLDQSQKKNQTAVDKTEGSVDNLASTISGKGIAAVVGFGLAIKEMTEFMADGVREFADYESLMNRAEIMTTRFGNSTGKTSSDIASMANNLARAGLGARNELIAAQNQLSIFNGLTKETFDRTLMASLDLAAAGFGDLGGNIEELGEVMELPAEAVTTLEKYGVFFDDIARKKLKHLQEQGKLVEAQEIILDKLEGRISGVAQAQAKGVAGEFARLDNARSEFALTIGKIVTESDLFIGALRGMTTALQNSEFLVALIAGDTERAFRNVTDEQLERAIAFDERTGRDSWFSTDTTGLQSALGMDVDPDYLLGRTEDKIAELSRRRDTREGQRMVQESIRRRKAREDANMRNRNLTAVPGLQDEGTQGEGQARASQEVKVAKARAEAQRELNRATNENMADAWKAEQEWREKRLKAEQENIDAINEVFLRGQESRARMQEEALRKQNAMATLFGVEGLQSMELNLEQQAQAMKAHVGVFSDMLTKAGERSKEAFQASKALGIAQATISGLVATVNAYKFGSELGGPVLGTIFGAVALASTGAIIGQIASQKYKGRRMGGAVNAGEPYLMGKGHGTEGLNVNGQTIVIPGDNGSVTPAGLMKGTGGIKVNIINRTPNPIQQSNVKTKITPDGQEITLELVEKYITNQMITGGNEFETTLRGKIQETQRGF